MATAVALHSAATHAASPVLGALQLHLADWPEAPDEHGVWTPVIPAPGAGGRIPSRDPDRPVTISDPAALVAALNAEYPAVRVDRDHRSERVSPTFAGDTAAEGWIEEFRLGPDGAIEGRMQLGAQARAAVQAKRYRYLSPALYQDFTRDGEVHGMSSVALVNDPNLIFSRTIHSGAGDDKGADKLTERYKALAARTVDAAIARGAVAAAQRGYHLAAIEGHGEGIEAGLQAFEAAFPEAGGAGDAGGTAAPGVLGQRVAAGTERGGVPAQHTAAHYERPPEVGAPSEQRLAMHHEIQALARERRIPYREALMLHARGERAGAVR